jgi:hypothetical protein
LAIDVLRPARIEGWVLGDRKQALRVVLANMDMIGTDAGSQVSSQIRFSDSHSHSCRQQSTLEIVEAHVFFKPKQGNGWQSKPELPTSQEILAEQSDIEQLPENPVDIPWPSKGEYLTAQYEILRREAIEGLRYSVRSVADYRRAQLMMDDDFTNIYTQVSFHQVSNRGVPDLTLPAGQHQGVRHVTDWPSRQSFFFHRALQVPDPVAAVNAAHSGKDRGSLPKERQLQNHLQNRGHRSAPILSWARSGSASRGLVVGQARGCRFGPGSRDGHGRVAARVL